MHYLLQMAILFIINEQKSALRMNKSIRAKRTILFATKEQYCSFIKNKTIHE